MSAVKAVCIQEAEASAAYSPAQERYEAGCRTQWVGAGKDGVGEAVLLLMPLEQSLVCFGFTACWHILHDVCWRVMYGAMVNQVAACMFGKADVSVKSL